MVVTAIEFQGSWTPKDIVQRYGHHVVSIEDCESGEKTESTAGEYFQEFGRISESPQRVSARKIKVRNHYSLLTKTYITCLGLAAI